MHPILSYRRRCFAAIWVPVGALAGALPFWAAGGRVADVWPLVVWGEALAAPVLASWWVCRFAPIGAGPGRVFATVGSAAVITAALWLAAGRVWIWMVASAAPTADLLFLRVGPVASRSPQPSSL